MRVLLVEDDPATAQSLQLMLESEGMVVDSTDLGEDGLEIGKLYDYDIILLDLMLPDIDGIEVLRRLRDARVDTPVLILSGLTEADNKVKGLGSGADDYLTKPFEFEELLARIRALLRRGEASEGRLLECDEIQLDLYTRKAKRGENEHELSNKEYALLEYLMRNPNRVLSRAQISEKVWDMNYSPGSNVIDVYMSSLRKKLDRGFDHELFHTIKGAGYRFGIMD